MRLFVATALLTLHFSPAARAQTCAGVDGPFSLEVTGQCSYGLLLEEYTRQVFDVTGSTCLSGSTVTAKEDFDAKITSATGAGTAEEAADVICHAMYDKATVTPFTDAADKGTDFHFEQMFYNGRGQWQEEIETIYETWDGSASSVLRTDAAKVRQFYHSDGSYSRVAFPDGLTNFKEPSCSSNAAMCCWPKDRQANDGNGNCAKPYDENCVNKDPADNTNLCFADLAKGDLSTGFGSDQGFAVFPGDNGDGEGSIHCHGFAWANDEYDPISRYRGNNLFFVSMYDHMHQRGYVENIPGMPMCACMDQMPMATRSDCTQVDLTEDFEVLYNGTSITATLTKVEIDFNACQGRNNANNNLWAYAARLYDTGRMTAQQFGKVGRVLTNDHDCYHAVESAKAEKGFATQYDHDASVWTKVAGREELKDGEHLGRAAFNIAFFEHSLTAPPSLDVEKFNDTAVPSETPVIMRICASCVETHRRIFYRRLTPAPEGHDVLRNTLYHRDNNAQAGSVWGVDFSLHSSYEDAKTGANPWKCPNNQFNYDAPFYGECSPTGARVRDQYSKFDWYPGPAANVAYYVNTPEGTGVEELDLNDRSVGTTDVDIGDTGLEGHTYTSADGSVYHVSGAGGDIWWYRDQFHYKSEPWSGDIDVSVHLTEFYNPSGQEWAKAGIMLRSDNSDDATYAFNLLSGKAGVCAQHRRSKGGHSASSGNCHLESPFQTSAWLRIVKKGEVVEFYRGDGADGWTLQYTDTFFFPDDSYRVGFAVLSHHRGVSSEATFADYELAAYEHPTASPTSSGAPTLWEPLLELDAQRAGSFDAQGGVDYLRGSGTGIWGTSDSMAYYNHKRANGDFSVGVYIKRFDNSGLHSRGGIMIRDSEDAGAANVFVGAAGGDLGVVFQSRPVGGESTDHHDMIYINSINQFWVKLDKVGGNVTASYRELEGDEWIELGSVDLTLTGDYVLVGRAVTAGSDYQYALETMETKNYGIGSEYLSSDYAPTTSPTLSLIPTSFYRNAITDLAVASSSSVCYGGDPARAIDGNKDGIWGNGGVMHTCIEDNPWLMVDLGVSYHINEVSVYNRLDCCKDRVGNTNVVVLDENMNQVATQPIVGLENVYTFNFGDVVGRYVKVDRQQDGQVLNLAEVEIVGYPADEV